MRGSKKILFLIIINAFLYSTVNAQDKQLNKQKLDLKKKIKFIKSLLNQNENSKKLSISQINSIKIKITSQKKLVQTIEKEIKYITEEISTLNDKTKKLEKDIEALKKSYSNSIIAYQRTKNNNNIVMFILSSKNFQQLIRRLKYLKLHSSYRKNQAIEINKKKQQNKQVILNLKKTQAKKLTLIAEAEAEEIYLQNLEKTQKEKLKTLQKKKNEYLGDIKNIRKKIMLIEDKIKKIIADRIKKSSAEEGVHAFEINKSQIRFPLKNGIITREFGIQPYPGLKDVFIENSGIYITTTKGSKAISVFDGEVAAVYIFPLGSMGVLIKHGPFYTFYGNLAQSYVKLNQKIKKDDEIGLVFTEPSTKVTELDFQIWKKKKKLDPKYWISNYKNHFLD